MTTVPVQVRRAAAGEAATLGAVLADAFSNDPVFAWLIPPDARGREQRMQAFFTSMSRSYLRRGKHCYLAGGDGAGALWSAPGSWTLPMGEILREAAPNWTAFRTNLLRALRTQLQVEGLHPKQPPHWYLGYLGARCDRQGQGLGGALLREVLSGADAQGVPAYLESSNERNLTLYERNGFRVLEEIRALGHGPRIWRMWREPASETRG